MVFEVVLNKFILIAGPCLAESYEILDDVAAELSKHINSDKIDFYFKASYRKANRSSINSVSGFGDELALSWIKNISDKYNFKTITDIHTSEEAELASKYADVIQIPAFLCRQTDLLLAAGKTGKIVNIKKGQFLSPTEMEKAAKKVASTGNNNIFLTERGTFFGYNDLVVDMRSIRIMKKFGYPVIYDATHSVQQPGTGEITGGKPEFIESLALAAISTGADGIFFETHPNPGLALSDSATQLNLSSAGQFIEKLLRLFEFINNL